MNNVLLETHGLVAGYVPEVDILCGVTLEVRHGELVAVIGPNGAGKSTLIKTLAGLLPSRDGRIEFGGRDVTRSPAHKVIRLGVAYVPQLDNIFPSLTVEENLEMGAFTRPKAARARMAKIFDILPPLKQRRRQRAGTMSGGERQMLALGRALMSEPTLLMLDEPSAGLAPTVVDAVFQTIKEINRSGLSVLLVEQNARRALAMAHRGYVLDLGKNRFEGRGADLLHDPKIADLYLGGDRRLEEGVPPPEE
jgi:ABC-type branched-subunit amino acid transport system ATPase component